MSMGMVDSLILEISRVIETVGDRIDYQVAKDASRKAARERDKRSKTPLPDLYRDGCEFELDHHNVSGNY